MQDPFPPQKPEDLPRWTHFRGNNLDGISAEQNLPVFWNDSTNIRWKTPVEGKGWSSPVVFGNQVWLTNSTREGKEMRAVCVDLYSGKILHDLLMFEPDTLYRIHPINSYATPTPAIEQGFLYVHFGRYGTACINTETGSTVWKRNDLQCEHVQGPGSSLLIYGDKLIVHLEGTDLQQILALDKRTGKIVWKTERPQECYEPLDEIGKKAYTTPLIVNVGGRDLMISNGSAVCIAYDPDTGEEVWRIVRGEDSTIAMPVEYRGTVFFYTGFVTDSDGKKHAELLAVNPDGTGDIGGTHILWTREFPILQLLTPVIHEGILYTVDSQGRLSCLDTATGRTLRSEKFRGKYNSSPLYADGHIYFSSTNGKTIVLKTGPDFEIVEENQLEGNIWATPAIADGALLVRTSEYLYKIG
jgi:outer membrane protein assembly factor BamB